MADPPEFQRIQEEFCAHLRDPRRHACPEGIEDRRMAIYRDLFFNNIHGLVKRSFPITAQVLGPGPLRELVYTFYSRHGCHTPYFHKIGQEFVDFLSHKPSPASGLPLFLAELAHFEWADVRIRLSEAPSPCALEQIDSTGDLLDHPLLLSPHAELHAYVYPVHRIGRDFQPQSKPDTPTFLFAFRNPAGKTRFMELNPATARLIALLKDQPEISARSQLGKVAAELGWDDSAGVVEGGRQVLERLRKRGAILGVRADLACPGS